MLKGAAAHTIDVSLLSGGWVLDAGCRDFEFTSYCAKYGCRVVALDPDPEVLDPGIEGVVFHREAIAAQAGHCDFALTDDVEARHIATANSQRRNAPYISVPVTTLVDIMSRHKIEMWDCVKMDIEGSEYEILLAWPGPIAKQITVEFHDHVEKRPAELYDRLFAHLDQWYRVVKYYAGDTLWVFKESPIGEPWWRK